MQEGHSTTNPYILTTNPSIDKADQILRINVECDFNRIRISLDVDCNQNVLQITRLIGERIQIDVPELVLAYGCRVLSQFPMSSLKSLGILPDTKETCDIRVIRKLPPLTWLQLNATFICSSSLMPLTVSMHKESSISNVKQQIREYLRCSKAVLSLHLADGFPLPDHESLADLGLGSDTHSRLFCRVHADLLATTPLHADEAAAAAEVVRQQIRQAEASWAAAGGGGAKRRRDFDDAARSRESVRRRRERGGTFLGMRRGFLRGAGVPSGSRRADCNQA
jgi:hypothetical protein